MHFCNSFAGCQQCNLNSRPFCIHCKLHLAPPLAQWWLQQLEDSCCPQLNHQRIPQEHQLRESACSAYLDKAVPGKQYNFWDLSLSMCLQSGSVAGPGPLRSVLANLRGKVSAVPRGIVEQASAGDGNHDSKCSQNWPLTLLNLLGMHAARSSPDTMSSCFELVWKCSHDMTKEPLTGSFFANDRTSCPRVWQAYLPEVC